MAKRSALLPLVRKFFERDPAAAAHSLETMDETEAAAILRALPSSLCAQAVPYLQVNHAATLLKSAPPELFTAIVEKLKPDQAAAIVVLLPEETRRVLLERLSETTRRQVQELLTYPENSVGRIMSMDFLAFREDVMAKDAIHRIRTLVNKNAPMSYAYVVNADNRLVGVLNMRELMLAPSEAVLGAVMRKDVFSVNGMTDREEVAGALAKRRFFAAPVVDMDQRLLGLVKTDQLLKEVQEDAMEDIQKMVGAGGDERSFSPILFSVRKRLPWLYINLATAFLAAAVVGLFQDLIAKVTILAVFLPVVAGQGGNAGAQSLAVVMRGLVLREIPPHKVATLVIKEGFVGAVNGLSCGVVTALVAWLWHGNPFLGLVIGLGMFVNLVAAGLAGALIPVIMKAMGFDPAQSSTIFQTTVTDVVGFFAFLGFALLFQHRLM